MTSACRRLTSGIFKPRRANRCTSRSTISGYSTSGTTHDISQRIARDVVVGRPEAAGQDDEVDAIESAAQVLGDFAATVADDGLRSQLDAERSQPLREKERVRIEARRAQQLAADRDDLGACAAALASLMPPIPAEQQHQQPQRHVGVDCRHRVVRHDAEAAVQRLEPPRGKRFDDVEDSKEEEPGERAALRRRE